MSRPMAPDPLPDRLENPPPRFVRGLEHWAKRRGGGGGRTASTPVCNETHSAAPETESRPAGCDITTRARRPARASNL